MVEIFSASADSERTLLFCVCLILGEVACITASHFITKYTPFFLPTFRYKLLLERLNQMLIDTDNLSQFVQHSKIKRKILHIDKKIRALENTRRAKLLKFWAFTLKLFFRNFMFILNVLYRKDLNKQWVIGLDYSQWCVFFGGHFHICPKWWCTESNGTGTRVLRVSVMMYNILVRLCVHRTIKLFSRKEKKKKK